MKFHTQRFRHDPASGVFGDCWRTAIACLLDLDPEDVPHEHREWADGEQQAAMRAWLAERGQTLIELSFEGSGWESFELFLTDLWMVVGRGPRFLLSGMSPRGFNHVVVARTDGVVHDPHPDRTGLVGPCDDGRWWVSFIGVRL